MSNFEVIIRIPDLAAALEKLAAAITGKPASVPQDIKTLPDPAPRVQQAPQQQQPYTVPTYQPAPIQPMQTYTPPTQQPAVQTYTPPVNPTPAPQQAGPAPAVQTAPTAQAPAYTLDDLARAAAVLMDAGKQQQLIALLGQFGVPSLMQLPKERYGEFATALRQMGAKI